MKPELYLEKIRLEKLHSYPFKHLIFSDFLNSADLTEIHSDVQKLELSPESNNFKSDYGTKKEWREFSPSLPKLHEWIEFLQSTEFIGALQRKFQLPENFTISPDKSFDGGGYVISPPNSFLGYHADFNFSSIAEKYRILNVLFYFNSSYSINQGGVLHLLDPTSKTVEKFLEPRMNTMLVFLTDDVSFHGVSRNSLDFYRRSFNLYYYASEPLSDNQSRVPHKTIWVEPTTH